MDNYGQDLTIKFGLEDSLNYYLLIGNSTNSATNSTEATDRKGFVSMRSMKELVDKLDVSITGRLDGSVNAVLVGELLGVPVEANAFISVSISDINNLIQKKPNAISVYYEADYNLEIPSFLDILLMDPQGIVDAVDSIFQSAEALSLGPSGVVTKLDAPFIGGSIGRTLKAGKPDYVFGARTMHFQLIHPRTCVFYYLSFRNSRQFPGESSKDSCW